MDAFLSVASMLFSNAWRMLTSIDFPGLGVPVAYVMIAVFLIDLSLRILGFVLGFVITPHGEKRGTRHGPLRPPPAASQAGPASASLKGMICYA